MATIRIEYPSTGATYYSETYGVYKYDEYPSYSVLAGQERRSFLDEYNTLEEAQSAYPEAEWTSGTGYRELHIPHEAPEWFDEMDAGERWDDDY